MSQRLLIINEYIEEIKDIYQLTKKLVKLKITDNDDSKYLYKSAIVNMCIKFESFTVHMYKLTFNKEHIAFNVPWKYVQEVSEKLNIHNDNQIMDTKECWHFYNALKHVNSLSLEKQKNFMRRHNMDHDYEVVKWIYESILNLLVTFI